MMKKVFTQMLTLCIVSKTRGVQTTSSKYQKGGGEQQ